MIINRIIIILIYEIIYIIHLQVVVELCPIGRGVPLAPVTYKFCCSVEGVASIQQG